MHPHADRAAVLIFCFYPPAEEIACIASDVQMISFASYAECRQALCKER
jgi:hypothetical protein